MGFWFQNSCMLATVIALLVTQLHGQGSAQNNDCLSCLSLGHSISEVEMPEGEFSTQESSIAQPCDDPGSTDSARFSSEPKLVGTDRCVQCHKDGHKIATYGVSGREYQVWADKDPHSCAYNTLFKEKSLSIAKKLKLETAPHKNSLCTNCHSPSASEGFAAEGCKPDPADGVGCESCHGAAEKWLVPHKFPAWKYTSSDEKKSLGFVDTDNFAARTRKCVECHVGSEGRDVNHDLIAAGHPRLYFEMSAYQSRLPRHWSRSKDLQINSYAAEAKLWLTGQFVSAAAALDLLKLRAADSEKPWPEFSEYACYSCHHDLDKQEQGIDEQNVFNNGVGKPIWGAWHFSVADPLSKELKSRFGLPFDENLEHLRLEMQKTVPDRKLADEMSISPGNSYAQLANLVSQNSATEQEIIFFASQFFGQGLEDDDLSWEALVQRYLAAVAIRQAILDSRNHIDFSGFDFSDSKSQLAAIRNSIRFAKNHDGPAKRQIGLGKEINHMIYEIFNPQKTRFP